MTQPPLRRTRAGKAIAQPVSAPAVLASDVDETDYGDYREAIAEHTLILQLSCPVCGTNHPANTRWGNQYGLFHDQGTLGLIQDPSGQGGRPRFSVVPGGYIPLSDFRSWLEVDEGVGEDRHSIKAVLGIKDRLCRAIAVWISANILTADDIEACMRQAGIAAPAPGADPANPERRLDPRLETWRAENNEQRIRREAERIWGSMDSSGHGADRLARRGLDDETIEVLRVSATRGEGDLADVKEAIAAYRHGRQQLAVRNAVEEELRELVAEEREEGEEEPGPAHEALLGRDLRRPRKLGTEGQRPPKRVRRTHEEAEAHRAEVKAEKEKAAAERQKKAEARRKKVAEKRAALTPFERVMEDLKPKAPIKQNILTVKRGRTLGSTVERQLNQLIRDVDRAASTPGLPVEQVQQLFGLRQNAGNALRAWTRFVREDEADLLPEQRQKDAWADRIVRILDGEPYAEAAPPPPPVRAELLATAPAPRPFRRRRIRPPELAEAVRAARVAIQASAANVGGFGEAERTLLEDRLEAAYNAAVAAGFEDLTQSIATAGPLLGEASRAVDARDFETAREKLTALLECCPEG